MSGLKSFLDKIRSKTNKKEAEHPAIEKMKFAKTLKFKGNDGSEYDFEEIATDFGAELINMRCIAYVSGGEWGLREFDKKLTLNASQFQSTLFNHIGKL